MGLSKPNIKKLSKMLDVEGLIEALRHSDWHVRRDAASALGKIADKKVVVPLLKKAVEPLIEALKDENAEVRRTAADTFCFLAIYRIVDEKVKLVEEALTEALNDKNVAWSAANALGIIPIPLTLEAGERLVRQIEDVNLELFAREGLLFLTDRRLIFNAVQPAGSFSYEISLADIVSCEMKKSFFGKKKLVVVSQQAVFKQRLQLVSELDRMRWKEVGTLVSKEPKPAVFTGIEQPEVLRSEIIEQVEICRKALRKEGR